MKEFIIEGKKGEWHIPLCDNAGLEELCRALNSFLAANTKVKYRGMKVINFRVENSSDNFDEIFGVTNGLQDNA